MIFNYDNGHSISSGNVSLSNMFAIPDNNEPHLAVVRVTPTATDPTSTVSVTITDGQGYSFTVPTLSISSSTNHSELVFPVLQSISMSIVVTGTSGGYETRIFVL